uniref:RING-type E3 ubiquitin transferase n=1 Tax=Meloidogyne javanica TaxID=6303 RepID=A0A915MZC6_MELJA
MASLILEASEHKEKGNKYYQQGRYEDSTEPTYFTNRALCNLNLQRWESAAEDCRRALDLDRKNIKANYYLGKVYMQLGQYDEAAKVLTRAHEYEIKQRHSYGDEITQLLRQAKREKFRKEEEARINQEIELQSYLNLLIDDDVKNKIDILQVSSNGGESLDDKIEEIKTKADSNPVITPSGITYDRNDILTHLHRVGHFDPVTRVPLTADQLIPNLAMREVVEHFEKENEWAVDA